MLIRRLTLVCLAASLAACGGSSSTPTAPAPPSPAQIAGTWTGTLTSSNWNPIAVTVQLTQSAGNLTGTWANAVNDWNGTISGTVDPSAFTGTFTISTPNALGVGPRCTGTASFSGGAHTGTSTLSWTSPGWTGSCTGFPVSVTVALQR